MIKKMIAWDLGATKCAAGIIEYDAQTKEFQCKQRFAIKLTETTSFLDLIHKIESGLDMAFPDAHAICIGAAGQYNGYAIQHLEGVYPYPMPIAEIANDLKWPVFDVLHDYAPIVCATFTSYMQQPHNLKRLNTCAQNPLGRRVALGVGTGLGMKDGVLLASGDFWLGKNEIGHIGVTLPPQAEPHRLAQHQALMQFLQNEKHYPITFEKILSGQGMVRLHQFFYPSHPLTTPEEVGKRLQNGQAPDVQAAFAWYLGLLVGAVQLTFMPEGGIWITGGVALSHLDIFDLPDFMAGIHASPAYRTQRDEYPLGILCNQEHALIGSGYYALRRLLTAA